MNEPTLHPNLAKIAAAYDEIVERHGRGEINPTRAREEISQLEARDDQGVRWGLDPDTGQWIFKTAMGDVEFDNAPPTFGYVTPDAFDYTQNPHVFNPAERLQMAAVNEQLEQAPIGLAGATRHTGTKSTRAAAISSALEKVSSASTKVKAIAAGTILVVSALALYACGGPADTPTTPLPQVTTTTPAQPSKKATKAPTKPAKPKATTKSAK